MTQTKDPMTQMWVMTHRLGTTGIGDLNATYQYAIETRREIYMIYKHDTYVGYRW